MQPRALVDRRARLGGAPMVTTRSSAVSRQACGGWLQRLLRTAAQMSSRFWRPISRATLGALLLLGLSWAPVLAAVLGALDPPVANPGDWVELTTVTGGGASDPSASMASSGLSESSSGGRTPAAPWIVRPRDRKPGVVRRLGDSAAPGSRDAARRLLDPRGGAGPVLALRRRGRPPHSVGSRAHGRGAPRPSSPWLSPQRSGSARRPRQRAVPFDGAGRSGTSCAFTVRSRGPTSACSLARRTSSPAARSTASPSTRWRLGSTDSVMVEARSVPARRAQTLGCLPF